MVEMLKLGKVITQSTASVHIFAFNFNEISWSKTPSTVDFFMDKEPFATGGSRQAFKATSNDKEFQGTWVIKKYLPKSISDIQPTGQSIEQQRSFYKTYVDHSGIWNLLYRVAGWPLFSSQNVTAH